MAFADSTNVKETSYQLRAYFVPWEELRRKQGALTASQLQAVNSGITSGFVALIAQNAADINTLRGLVTAQIRLRKVTALPDEGEANVLYLVPDAGADPTSPDQCTEYIWDDDRYEIVGKTSVTPGNGKLTINVNGQAAGSFSADQSTDTTIGITVPLAVSDLQNDSGFQTASDVAAAVAALSAQLAAVAFSGSYDDLTDKPSYPGIGDGTLTIAQNGTQVGSFTANQDTASTINIVTPTKTSDLQNDSGFVDTSDLDTKQDELSEVQLAAVNSGVTDTAVAQIEVNRVAIQGKQAQLTQTQLNAVNSGITSGKVALFDAHLADTDAHVTAAQKAAWTAKQDALNANQLNAVNSGVTAQKVTDYDDHVADADIHVTAAQKAAWTAKQDALTANQLNAVNSGVTAQKVTDYDSHIADAGIHVTATDRDAWNAKQDALNAAQLNAVNSGITSALVTQIGTNQTDIATKANDSDVVHRSGAETIEGPKTFSEGVFATGSKWPANTNTTEDITSLGQVFYCQQRSGGTLTDLSNGGWNVTQLGGLGLFARNNNYSDIRYKHFFSGTLGRIHTLDANGYEIINLVPAATNIYTLGTSSNKWKSLNGVDPGVLSLSDNSNYVNISSNITDLTGNKNTYTAPATGYVMVNVKPDNNYAYVALERITVRQSAESTTGRNAMATISVIAGQAIDITVIGASIAQARFSPCLGNV